MAHTLVIGKTGSGKTTLIRQIAKTAQNKGTQLLVLDPTPANDQWGADYVTDDPHEFLQVVFANTRCLCIVDEAGSMIGRFGKDKNDLATRSRHMGHSVIFITQDVKSLDNIVREQVRDVIVFRVGRKRAAELAEDFADDNLKMAGELVSGECLIKIGDNPAYKYQVFNKG